MSNLLTVPCLMTKVASRFNISDRFLSRVLDSEYVHTELLFPDSFEIIKGQSFSSRGRVKDCKFSSMLIQSKVPRGAQFANPNYDKGKWIRTPLLRINTDYRMGVAYRLCKKHEGKKYDWRGAIFNAGLNCRRIDNLNRFWCSEVAANVILPSYPELLHDNYDPAELLAVVDRCHRIDKYGSYDQKFTDSKTKTFLI